MAFPSHLARWAKLYNGTEPELALEPYVAALGIPYRFQHPVWSCGLFPDYAWPTVKLVLEIDGDEHHKPAGLKKDALRTAKLAKHGWTVIRCTNEEALTEPRLVITRVQAALDALSRKGIRHGSI